MLLFDAHLDIAMNALEMNRDLRMTVAEIRALEAGLGMTDPGRQTNTLSFPELRRAEIGLCVATTFARLEPAINHPYGRTTPEACYAFGMAHRAYYKAQERAGVMRMIRSRGDLRSHLAAWTADPERAPLGYILSMECADQVLDPDQIHEWYEAGLRAIGITHYGGNRYGGGTRSDLGLALEARALLDNIQRLGLPLDLTHLSDRSFWQALDLFGGRVLASHQNCRKFCDWQRQFSDEQVLAVVRRDGVIGVALDAVMLQPGWVRGVSKPEVTLERVVDNIDHVCQLAGDARHAGVGSDLDGGYGKEQTPADLDTIADLQKLPALLEKRGYSRTDVEAIMHGNWIRFFSETLPA
jgi:membrane dipeptidase